MQADLPLNNNTASPPAPAGQPAPGPRADAKPWWQSRTIIGILIAVLPHLLHRAGLDVSADDPAFASAVADSVSALGAVLAVYGRARATRPLSGSIPPGAPVALAAGWLISHAAPIPAPHTPEAMAAPVDGVLDPADPADQADPTDQADRTDLPNGPDRLARGHAGNVELGIIVVVAVCALALLIGGLFSGCASVDTVSGSLSFSDESHGETQSLGLGTTVHLRPSRGLAK